VLIAAALAFVVLLVTTSLLVLRRRPQPAPVRVLAEAVPPPVTISGEVDPMGALDALLAELEGATVRIDGADELDESAVVELEQLADKFEAAAAGLESRA
jgi:hypothetical protein